MIGARTWAAALALLVMAAAKPAAADTKLRGSAAKSKPKAATAVDRLQALIEKKAPWGLYDAAHWSAAGATLREASGNGRDVVSEGKVEHGSGDGHGAKGKVPFIFGSTSSRLFWPEGSIPNGFTICSITRYTGGTNAGILRGARGGWIHGHWEDGAGAVFYEDWITSWEQRERGTTNWAVVCGSNGLPAPKNILYNGAAVGFKSGGPGANSLCINPTASDYVAPGDWALSFVAIWDQHLAAEEMQSVSDALMEYLATGRSLVPVTAAAVAPTTTITISDNNGTTTVTTSHGTTTTTTAALDSSSTTVTNNGTTATTTTADDGTLTTTTTIPGEAH